MSESAEGAWRDIEDAIQTGRADDARALLEKRIDDLRADEDRLDLLRALRTLAQLHEQGGRPDDAVAAYHEAVNLSRGTGDPRIVAHTVRHLGDVQRRAGRIAEARQAYEEALELYADLTASDGEVANAIRPMALLLEAAGETAEAVERWRAARRLYERAGIRAGVEECDLALARLDPD